MSHQDIFAINLIFPIGCLNALVRSVVLCEYACAS
jgi:hypothetical protein